eukprot:4433875-Karenia_brevis.AAC.1
MALVNCPLGVAVSKLPSQLQLLVGKPVTKDSVISVLPGGRRKDADLSKAAHKVEHCIHTWEFLEPDVAKYIADEIGDDCLFLIASNLLQF